MLHEVVEVQGSVPFMGIVVRRPRCSPSHPRGGVVHVLVGYQETHHGSYGSLWEGVEYGAYLDEIVCTGRIVKP